MDRTLREAREMRPETLPRVILFDVDETLLDCGPQVRPLFAAALQEVFGTSGGVEHYDFAGRTDPQIVFDLMREAGFGEQEIAARLPRMRDLYLDRLEAALDRGAMRLLPGVEALLARLARRARVALGLLTGNWERGARSKLARFDLNRYFGFGAFGGDGIERSELPPIALARAASLLGRHFEPRQALIVGDSVHDVSCARHHGIPVLAVATGKTRASTLAAAQPDWLASSLHAAAVALPWLGG
jgi:phosphoglycolate phosphatase